MCLGEKRREPGSLELPALEAQRKRLQLLAIRVHKLRDLETLVNTTRRCRRWDSTRPAHFAGAGEAGERSGGAAGAEAQPTRARAPRIAIPLRLPFSPRRHPIGCEPWHTRRPKTLVVARPAEPLVERIVSGLVRASSFLCGENRNHAEWLPQPRS